MFINIFNAISTVMDTLKRIESRIEKIENQEEKERLGVRIIDWLCVRVDVLEKKLKIVPPPIPKEV